MPDNSLEEKLQNVVREQILTWAKAVPDQNGALVGTGSSGRSFSAKDIHEHVEKRTDMGRRMIDTYTRMAVEKATEDILKSFGVAPKDTV